MTAASLPIFRDFDAQYDDGGDPDFPWATLDGPNYFTDALFCWMPLLDPPND